MKKRQMRQEEMHERILCASNKKILRRQLELLAEYCRMSDGNEQIPACSREMVQIYRELVKAKIRTILFSVGLFGVGFGLLYGFERSVRKVRQS